MELQSSQAGAYHSHHHLGHSEWKNTGVPAFYLQTPEGPRAGCGEQDSMLPRMSEARLQVLLRNQPAGRNQGLATPEPLLQHEGLSSRQMGYRERGAALWECFLEEEEEVWAFGLVEGGESSLPSRGTVVGNQWQ